jgi:hypothetical protein
VSSPASRKRQRQRRRAREKLWTAQSALAARAAIARAYDLVIADMDRRYQEPAPLVSMQALAIVTVCRGQIQNDCVRLRGDIANLEIACKQLEPAEASL